MRRMAEMVAAGLAGATFSSEEAVIRTKDRKRIHVGITISQLRDENGNSLGIVLIFKNLTEIKQIRDQIARTERMASLGYLAAGLAHELRNPLGSLQGLAELIREDLPEGDPKRVYADTFIREIDRMNMLVEDLLCFAQPPITTLERRSLNDVVHDSLVFAGYDFQHRHVEVKTRDLLRHLRRHGCDLKREGGVHALWPSSVMRPVGAVRRQPVVSSLLANTVRAGLSVPPVIE